MTEEVLEVIKRLEKRIEDLEKDVEYLSKKAGVHDLYFNRIHSEEEE